MKLRKISASRPHVIQSYQDLVEAFRTRRHDLELPQLEVDELAGLASGYTAKVEISDRPNLARNARAIGRESLPLLLGALKADLLLVPRGSIRPAVSTNRAENSRKGGKRRLDSMTPEERSESARKAAQARWGTNPEAYRGRARSAVTSGS